MYGPEVDDENWLFLKKKSDLKTDCRSHNPMLTIDFILLNQ